MAVLGLALMIIGAALGVSVLGTAAVGAGWEPTSHRKVKRMLELAGAGPSDVVYDLGSGDGRIIIEAARAFRSKSVGVEADPLRVIASRLAVSLHRLDGRASVVWGNFFHVNLYEATVVTLFLTQRTNRKLMPKLLSELRPGARVVSYVWTLEGWAPASRDEENHLSLYIVPDQSPRAECRK